MVDFFRQYVSEKNIDNDELNRSLRYAMEARARGAGPNERFSLSGGEVAEGIDLFHLKSAEFFDGRLHSVIFGSNNWEYSKLKDNMGLNREAISIGCGGKTNYFLMVYERRHTSLADFKDTAISKAVEAEMYPNWRKGDPCKNAQPYRMGSMLDRREPSERTTSRSSFSEKAV